MRGGSGGGSGSSGNGCGGSVCLSGTCVRLWVFPDDVPRKERRGPGLLLNHSIPWAWLACPSCHRQQKTRTR